MHSSIFLSPFSFLSLFSFPFSVFRFRFQFPWPHAECLYNLRHSMSEPLSVFSFLFRFQFSFFRFPFRFRQSQVSKGCETLFERKFQFPVHADCVSVITPQSTFGRAKTRCVCCKTSARIGARSIYFSNFAAVFGKNPSITTLNTNN